MLYREWRGRDRVREKEKKTEKLDYVMGKLKIKRTITSEVKNKIIKMAFEKKWDVQMKNETPEEKGIVKIKKKMVFKK